VHYTLVVEAERRKNHLPPRVAFTKMSPSDTNYETTGTDNIRDKLHGIPIDVSVEIGDGKRNRRQAGAVAELSPASFLKEGCGADNVCQSNLVVKHRYCSKKPNQDVFTPLPLEGGVPVVSLSNQKEIALEITPVTCTANKNGSQAECELGNPFKRDSKVTFYIILSTAGISLNTSAVEVDLQLQT
ncbi:hypothetical protein CRUP_016228, partial [Coryphaenoides rupestris]